MAAVFLVTILFVKTLLMLLILSSLALAADYKDAKIIEFHDASQVGAATVNNTNPSGPASTEVPALNYRCLLTVEIDHVRYSAVYPVNDHFRIGDLTPGDTIPARVVGNKLVIRTADGKEMKSKIVERAAPK